MTPSEWRRAALLAAVILGLHAVGFFILLALVVPNDYSLAGGGVFGLGVGITAYTLGLRHAFDADHIAAIDSTTRKLMAEGQRPLSVGFFFSLGHSTIVFALGALVVVGVRGLSGALESDGSTLHQATGLIGPAISGGFLLLIGLLNLAILLNVMRIGRELRQGELDEAELERALGSRGADEPRVRARHAGDPQAVAHVSAGLPVRARLRHGHRGRAARPGRRGSGERPAVLRDPLPADPVRGRHVAVRHDRRRVHELRLRLGVLAAGAQALLQHHRDGPVGGRGAA